MISSSHKAINTIAITLSYILYTDLSLLNSEHVYPHSLFDITTSLTFITYLIQNGTSLFLPKTDLIILPSHLVSALSLHLFRPKILESAIIPLPLSYTTSKVSSSSIGTIFTHIQYVIIYYHLCYCHLCWRLQPSLS